MSALELCGFASCCSLLLALALGYRRKWLAGKTELHLWINRAFAAGYSPLLSEARSKELLRDLFSTERDVERLREWRERRAVSSIDHTLRHSVEAECDGDAAREILLLCCGGDEVSE